MCKDGTVLPVGPVSEVRNRCRNMRDDALGGMTCCTCAQTNLPQGSNCVLRFLRVPTPSRAYNLTPILDDGPGPDVERIFPGAGGQQLTPGGKTLLPRSVFKTFWLSSIGQSWTCPRVPKFSLYDSGWTSSHGFSKTDPLRLQVCKGGKQCAGS